MSNNSPNHYGSAFESSVIHYYQQKMRRLRGTVRERNVSGANAKDLTFFRMGKSVAQQRARGADITIQNQDMPVAKVTPVEIESSGWVDRQDEKRMTYDNKDAIARSIAMGLARAADDQIIQAGYAAQADAVANAGRTALDYSAVYPNLKHLTAISARFGSRDVPKDGLLTLLVTDEIFANWMLYPAFASSDWVGTEGQLLRDRNRTMGKYWSGLNIMTHIGLSKTGDTDTDTARCLLYHESAIGHAALDDITIETANTLANNKPGTNIYGYFDAGAVHIDYDGVEEVIFKNHVEVD